MSAKAKTVEVSVERPLVSVVITCFNVEGYIDQCISSVCHQSYCDLEVILVDDGSTDGTGDLCDGWAIRDDRVTVIHQANAGPAAARNAGVDRATGGYLTFVDGDDFVLKTYVEEMVDLAERGNHDFVMCGFSSVDSTGGCLERRELKGDRPLDLAQFVRGLMLGVYLPSSWAKLFRRDLFEGLRYTEGRLFEDTLIWANALQCWGSLSVSFSTSVLYCYRQNSASIMHTFNGAREGDLVHAWDTLCEQSSLRFSSCRRASSLRRTWSRFNLLDRMIKARELRGPLFKDVINYLAANKADLLDANLFGKRGKLAFLLLPKWPSLYITLTRVVCGL